jgi:hypothetical protein
MDSKAVAVIFVALSMFFPLAQAALGPGVVMVGHPGSLFDLGFWCML